MAQIIPIDTDLGDIQEGGSVDRTFTVQLDTTDTLKSINIIDYQSTPGIIVEGARYFGNYESVFSYSNDALKYRENDEFKVAETWEDLPSQSADLYLWRAPSKLERTFTYTVECIYDYQDPESSGGSGESGGTPPVERRITKTYSQLVYGNWSRWSQRLRDYVYSRG
ncbi:hypothetical protein CkP1_0167 [Citrobacter phage CkP1]|nr:hypothetical protein CkP1_0167 [Citrobacter phage CkP1]